MKNDSKEFLEAVDQSRTDFVEAINSVTWSTKMRTQAESLIIIFDQMRSRLAGGIIDAEKEQDAWKEKYFTLLEKWKTFKPVEDDSK